MGRGRSWAAAAATLACAAAGAPAPAAAQQPPTTSHVTVGGERTGAYARLRPGPGWKRVVRADLAEPRRGRSVRRRSLVYAAQLSDFQLADEESPARVEALDLPGTPFTSAWRPQEALVPHAVDEVVRQVNRFGTSPVRSQRRGGRKVRAKLAFAFLTGDNVDNQQVNETKLVVGLLEGGRVDPGSGVETTAPCAGGAIPPGEARRYTGVQDHDDLPLSMASRFYDPDAPGGDFAGFPRWPGLMDRAQEPFDAAGLRVPSYVALGNHDGTVQGNLAANAVFEAVVTGCTKPLAVSGLDPAALATSLQRGIAVPPDPERRFASRKEYAALHATGRQADAHGFGLVDAGEARASAGHATYYAWAPKPGVRFVAINTVGEGSNVPGSEGNLDRPQFRWLERVLDAAQARRELVVVFGHHPIRTLTNREPDEDARRCGDPTAGPGCDGDPRDSKPLALGPDLQRLLLAHRTVVAYVAGHTHEHRITPFRREGGGGFWGIETASEVDWPIQSRLVELFDNRDGTLSLFGTVIDHGAPVATPASGTAAGAFTPRTLASIARELSFNDPQLGAPGGEGRPEDRNVELVLPDPRR